MAKTSICSVIAIEIIDYARKTEAEQAEINSQLDNLLNTAVVDVAEADRNIARTEQGAIIACSGLLEEALEDALLIAITIRDEILKNNADSLKPWYAQLGISIGGARATNNKKGELEINGEGVDEAKHIMSFANPNQILASRVYFEMAAKLSPDIASMFDQYDMHAHEQELYAVRLLKPQAGEDIGDTSELLIAEHLQDKPKKFNWKFVASVMAGVVALGMFGKWALTPSSPQIVMDPPVATQQEAKAETHISNTLGGEPDAQSQSQIQSNPQPVIEPLPAAEQQNTSETKPSAKPAHKTAVAANRKLPVDVLPPVEAHQTRRTETIVDPEAPSSGAETKPAPAKPAVKHEKKEEPVAQQKTSDKSNDKSTWDSIKDSVTKGTEHQCSQAEKSMGQCTN